MISRVRTAGRTAGTWWFAVALCALGSLSACDSSGEVLAAARAVEVAPRETSAAVRAERQPRVLESFAPADFEFAAETGRLADGRWRPLGRGPSRVTLRGEFPLDDIERIALSLEGLRETRLRIALRKSGELLGVLELSPQDTLASAAWVDLTPELIGTADELVLAFSRFDAELSLGTVQFLARPPAARVPLPGGGPQSVTVGDTSRLALGLTPSAPVLARAEYEPGDELRFAIACLGDQSAEVVLVARQGETEVRRTFDVEAVDHWSARAESLDGFSPGTVDLRLELHSGDACAVSEPLVVRPQADPPTVVLITSDTHRGDHLGFLEDGVDIETPNLDALAARGTVFLDARSSTHITNPSHISIFTGVHPHDHGILDNRTPLTSDAQTLAEAFHDAGWSTLAATSAGHLAPDRSGLGQGFDAFVAPGGLSWGGYDSIAKLEQLMPEADGRPAFIWLHLFDAHTPYRPVEHWMNRYVDPGHDPYDPALPSPPRQLVWDRELRDFGQLAGLYRAEVSQEDERLGSFLEHPRVLDAWIAFTGDHGERLDAEGGIFDHRTLDLDSLHVPLILVGEGVPAGVQSAAEVTNQDVGRTLLDLSGFETFEFPGRDLLRIAPDATAPRFAVARFGQSASVEHEGWMFVRHILDQSSNGAPIDYAAGQEQLFHLTTDRECRVDLIESEPTRAADLRSRLDRFLESGRELDWGIERVATPAELIELEALGYAGG